MRKTCLIFLFILTMSGCSTTVGTGPDPMAYTASYRMFVTNQTGLDVDCYIGYASFWDQADPLTPPEQLGVVDAGTNNAFQDVEWSRCNSDSCNSFYFVFYFLNGTATNAVYKIAGWPESIYSLEGVSQYGAGYNYGQTNRLCFVQNGQTNAFDLGNASQIYCNVRLLIRAIDDVEFTILDVYNSSFSNHIAD